MKFFTLFTLILVLTACIKHREANILVVDTQAKVVKPANLSDIFQKGSLVKLDAGDTCLISTVGQINTTKDFIFVRENKRLLQFDKSGRLIKQIGSHGRGPGQYNIINHMAIDSLSERIFISSRKLLCYDFDGIYKRSLDIIEGEDRATGYIGFADGYLWAHNQRIGVPNAKDGFTNVDRFYIFNQHLQITDSILVREIMLDREEIAVGGSEYFISDLTSGIYLYCPVLVTEPMLRDTLYKLNGLTAQPIMKLDFSDILSVEEGVKIDFSTMTFQERYNADMKIRNMTIYNIFRTERYVFAEYNYLDKPYFFCYDLFDQKGYNMKEGFTDDLFGTGKTVNLMPLNLRNGEFCFVKNGYELEGIIEGVNENSNPVIFFVKTRERNGFN
ncbi:MAG: 6-bladed beta-propeller [Bacteroidales bacterium]|nr:6-bladed beta-propeller [Bacteroidales bacterium]